ncbi:MAG: RCC1 domain-containing protein [Oligoflexales bacterium]
MKFSNAVFLFSLFFVSCQKDGKTLNQRASSTDSQVSDSQTIDQIVIFPDQELYFEHENGFIYVPVGVFEKPVLGQIKDLETLGIQNIEKSGFSFDTVGSTNGRRVAAQKDIKVCLKNKNVDKKTVVLTSNAQGNLKLEETFFEKEHTCVWTRVISARFRLEILDDLVEVGGHQNLEISVSDDSIKSSSLQNMSNSFEVKKEFSVGHVTLAGDQDILEEIEFREEENTLHLELKSKEDIYTFENGKICLKTRGKNIRTMTMMTSHESVILEGWKEEDYLCIFLETLDATFVLSPQKIDSFSVEYKSAQDSLTASVGPFQFGDQIRFYQDNECHKNQIFEKLIQKDKSIMNFEIPLPQEPFIYMQVTNSQGGYSPCIRKDLNKTNSSSDDLLLSDLLTPVVKEDNQGAVISSLNQPRYSIQKLKIGAQLIAYRSSHCQGKPWAFYPITKNSMEWVTPPLEEGEHHLSLRQSNQGVLSACRSGLTWTVDSQPPKVVTLEVAIEQQMTSQLRIPIQTKIEGAQQVRVSQDSQCETGVWSSYDQNALFFEIEKKNSRNILYFQWRDAALNETSCYPLSILHDDVPPLQPEFSVLQDVTRFPYVDLSFSAETASYMKISKTEDCSSGLWETFQTSKKRYKIDMFNQEVSFSVVYKDDAGNETPCLSDRIVHDNLPPLAKKFQVFNEKQTTSLLFVDLEVDAIDASAMYITYAKGCLSGGVWEPYQSLRRGWPIFQKNKENIVYAMFRDNAGNHSKCLSLSVTHDDEPPLLPEMKFIESPRTSNEEPVLEMQVFGASQMYLTSHKKCKKGGQWEAYQSKKKWKILKKNKKNKVFAKFRDTALNTSKCVVAEIVHDDRKPKKSRIKIASGRKFIDTLTVTLSLRSIGAHDMYITNQPDCLKGGLWEPYDKIKTGWVLEQENSVATVYGMFRDQAGNMTKCLSDTILHDDTPPQAPESFRDGDMTISKSESPEMNWIKSNDKGGSGIGYYEIAIGSSPGLQDVQDWIVPERKRSTRTTFRSLNLPPGKRFYASLRAVDKAGNKSQEVHGDGFLYRSTSKVLEAGRHSTCAVSESGKLYCWGQNTYGKLGHGDTQNKGYRVDDMKNLPVTQLGKKQHIRQLSLFSGHHVCAVLENGHLKCWGNNQYGQLGLEHALTQGDEPKEMGKFLSAVGLQKEDVLQVIAGSTHTCALVGDGYVKCWGGSEYGQIGSHHSSNLGDEAGEILELNSVDLGDFSVVEMAGGREHNCALSRYGEVKCWGRNDKGQLGLSDHKHRGAIHPGNDMGDALPTVDFGANSDVQHIAAGYDHTCALFENGFMKCWGRNDKGQLGLGLRVKQGDKEIRNVADLSVVNLGAERTAISIAAGGHTTCAVLDNYTLKCWGLNSYGQLGQGDKVDRGGESDEMGESLHPIDFSGGRVSHVSVGVHHVCAVVDDSIKCWGRNDKGQLGQDHPEDVGDDPLEMTDFLKETILPE